MSWKELLSPTVRVATCVISYLSHILVSVEAVDSTKQNGDKVDQRVFEVYGNCLLNARIFFVKNTRKISLVCNFCEIHLTILCDPNYEALVENPLAYLFF